MFTGFGSSVGEVNGVEVAVLLFEKFDGFGDDLDADVIEGELSF